MGMLLTYGELPEIELLRPEVIDGVWLEQPDEYMRRLFTDHPFYSSVANDPNAPADAAALRRWVGDLYNHYYSELEKRQARWGERPPYMAGVLTDAMYRFQVKVFHRLWFPRHENDRRVADTARVAPSPYLPSPRVLAGLSYQEIGMMAPSLPVSAWELQRGEGTAPIYERVMSSVRAVENPWGFVTYRIPVWAPSIRRLAQRSHRPIQGWVLGEPTRAVPQQGRAYWETIAARIAHGLVNAADPVQAAHWQGAAYRLSVCRLSQIEGMQRLYRDAKDGTPNSPIQTVPSWLEPYLAHEVDPEPIEPILSPTLTAAFQAVGWTTERYVAIRQHTEVHQMTDVLIEQLITALEQMVQTTPMTPAQKALKVQAIKEWSDTFQEE